LGAAVIRLYLLAPEAPEPVLLRLDHSLNIRVLPGFGRWCWVLYRLMWPEA